MFCLEYEEINQQKTLVQTRARWVVRGFIVDTNEDVYFFRALHLALT